MKQEVIGRLMVIALVTFVIMWRTAVLSRSSPSRPPSALCRTRRRASPQPSRTRMRARATRGQSSRPASTPWPWQAHPHLRQVPQRAAVRGFAVRHAEQPGEQR